MADRVAKKDKINSSGKSNNNNNNETGPHSSHRQHHHQSSSQQKDVPFRTQQDDNSTSDTFVKRYKVIEKIGEGSYSEVLKCQNRHDGTTVACKRLKHIYKSLDDVTNISEITTLRSIQKHSNILQMIEIHYDKALGKVSLVFELMDINLYELIKDRKRLLPESRVRTILFQLFKALRHLHKLGVFHRDIKPENILIKAKTDQLKLGDLGSVRGMFSRPPYTEYISTRWYRSPECLLTAGHYSHKMDIWAAGCVFYEVLTLRPLFPGSSEIDQINRINNVLGPPPLKLLDTFQKQAELERETYRGQSQLSRRQQIQKVLNSYSSRYIVGTDSSSKNTSSNSVNYRKNNAEFHFSGKEGTGLEKILPAHITREAKDLIKSCLLYDPEQRPSAQRIVQLSYFSELRENYSKNQEKISSKPVVLICGDTVTDQCTRVELSTLGDHKIRYKRGGILAKENVSKSTSVPKVLGGGEQNSASIKSPDNNNNDNNRHRVRSRGNTDDTRASKKTSQRRLTSDARTSGSQLKVATEQGKKLPKNESLAKKSSSFVKSSASRIGVTNSEQTTEASRYHTSKNAARVRSKCSNNDLKQQQEQQQRLAEPHKNKHNQSSYSTTSFESVQSPERNDTKNAKRKDKQQFGNGPKPSILAFPDVSLSPYVKPPSELKFLREKIKNVQNSRTKLALPAGQVIGQQGQPKNSQTIEQQLPMTRVAVVPPKVAAAAIKYAKINSRNARGEPVALVKNNTTDRIEGSSSTNIVFGGGSRRDEYSPTDDTLSYATASSVKIGKLRFRQTTNEINKQNSKALEESSSVNPSSYGQISKIPVLVNSPAEASKSSRKNSKILSSPPEQRRDSADTTEKWRNTGIPRMISMSPERERNIQLLKESLTLDNNKRVKLHYRQQDEENNNSKSGGRNHHESGMHARKLVISKNNFDDASQETLPSTGEQQKGTHSSAGGGKCRNSTTDYENPDQQDTSSASAAAFENQQRNIFNVNSKNGRIVAPPLESVMKKPIPVKKKSSELYPPEMLRLYSSRYRGPDINMNILKDSGNSYVKQGQQPENRSQMVKEKLNRKFEQRGQRHGSNNTSSGQQIGDQPSKIISERSSYGHYSSSLMGAGEEEQFTRVGIAGSSRMSKRPPLPPAEARVNGRIIRNPSGFRDLSPDASQPYGYYYGQKASQVSLTGAETRNSERVNRNNSESSHNLKKKPPLERLRGTMRDDVFCSSDDDVVISMRKKFDSLISERARKLSESLKSNTTSFAGKSARNNPPSRSRRTQDSDEDMLQVVNRRLRSNAASEKSRKHARRELRARMAESLTTNNYTLDDDWRFSELSEQKQTLLENKASNDKGDWMFVRSKYRDKYGKDASANNNDSSALRTRKNITADRETQDGSKYQSSNRMHPFPMQEQHAYRRGQIFTPPINKQTYHPPQIGTILYDRQFRYTHNNPIAIPAEYKTNSVGKVKDVSILKQQQHQRI